MPGLVSYEFRRRCFFYAQKGLNYRKNLTLTAEQVRGDSSLEVPFKNYSGTSSSQSGSLVELLWIKEQICVKSPFSWEMWPRTFVLAAGATDDDDDDVADDIDNIELIDSSLLPTMTQSRSTKWRSLMQSKLFQLVLHLWYFCVPRAFWELGLRLRGSNKITPNTTEQVLFKILKYETPLNKSQSIKIPNA